MTSRIVLLLGVLAVACSSSEETTSKSPSAVAGGPDSGPSGPIASEPIAVDAAVVGDVSTPPMVTADEACTRFADAFCGTLDAQCTEATFRNRYGDATLCRDRTKVGCLQLLATEEDSWTPALRVECANAIVASTSCHDAENHFARVSACVSPPGPRPLGAGCWSDGQCATGVCLFTTTSCGTCANKVPAGGLCTMADLCEGTGFECLCVGEGCPERRCGLVRKVGEACGAQNICADGAVCKSGTCAATGPGTDCAAVEDCAYPFACNSTTAKCEERVVALPGAACGWLPNGGWAECAGAVCNFSDGFAGTCSNVAADGAACDANNTCKFRSVCSNGFCAPPVQVVCN